MKDMLISFLLISTSMLEAATKDEQDFPAETNGRTGRTLKHTFPFNQIEKRKHVDRLKQNSKIKTFDRFQSASINSIPEERCVHKVVMEERVEYDQGVECSHSYDRRCFTSLSTTYTPTQEEECEENYIKECFISNSHAAENVSISVCRTPLVKDCSLESEDQVCSTQYEAECLTTQHVHLVEEDTPECVTVKDKKCKEVTEGYKTGEECVTWPREVCSVKKETKEKFTPETECHKIPIVLCGPRGCGFTEGAEECHEKVKTVVFDKPEEVCNLSPKKSCKFVTKLVPQLKEVETCSDVPKEICFRVEKNPHKIKYPVIKKWCYKYSKCSDFCKESTKWGECPKECKKYEGDPDCCAPKCPSKCTNKRRDECSANGVLECEGIAGCCPEKFTSISGAVTFGHSEPSTGYLAPAL